MSFEKVDPFKYADYLNRLLTSNGVFLVSEGASKKPNAMNIGWGYLGTMWGQTTLVIAVRKSRYTYKLLEESETFTVCLPAKGMEKALAFCGTKSGRDVDKLKELNLATRKGEEVPTPYLEDSPVRYECETLYKTEIKQEGLAKKLEPMYKTGDMHALYIAQVKGCYAVKDAEERLPHIKSPKILVVYDSSTGNTEKMADGVAEGVKRAGGEAIVKKASEASVDELTSVQGLILGSPVYYGLPSASVKKFIDDSVKYHGRLETLVGGAFASAGGAHTGAETTVVALLEALLVHGMIVKGSSSGSHYGAATMGAPDDPALERCRKLGERVTRLAAQL